MRSIQIKSDWTPYLERYNNGEWRATIFRDMILSDAQKMSGEQKSLTFLDIGCGAGFDDDKDIQISIAQNCRKYIGIEPDTDITLNDIFDLVHNCTLEEAPIEPESIDIAFAVMVLEHIENPEKFWNKVYNSLRPGGVFWGFTIDTRHWFAFASRLTERLHVKDLYLKSLHGTSEDHFYENYPVFYKSNNPKQIQALTKAFDSVTLLNFYREGQMDFYLPKMLRWISRVYDRFAIRRGWPGSIMAIRAEKLTAPKPITE